MLAFDVSYFEAFPGPLRFLFQMVTNKHPKGKSNSKGLHFVQNNCLVLHSQVNEIHTITSILLTDLKIIDYFAQRYISTGEFIA